MRKGIIPILLLASLLMLTCVEAAYPKYHIYSRMRSWDEVNSPITQMCKGKEYIVDMGQATSDAPVIHYLEGGKKIASYVGTHTASSYTTCMRNAGADVESRCFCIGNAIHPTTGDVSSHTEQVPDYIKRYWFLNVPVHLATEKAMEMKLEDYVKRHPEYGIAWEEVVVNSQNSFDPMFEDPKYMNLLDRMSGIDMRTDVAIVGGALKGEKWQAEVYGKKIYLPSWSYAIGIGLMVVFGLLTLVVVKYGHGWFKWVTALETVAIAVLGLLIFLSLILGTSWMWFDAALSVPASMISISDEEFEHYLNQDIARTELFLKDGVQRYSDWTGLSYVDPSGKQVNGELNKAENRFWYIAMPISTILTLGWGYLNYRWVFKKKKKR